MTLLQANQPTGSNNNARVTRENPREWAQGRRALIVEE